MRYSTKEVIQKYGLRLTKSLGQNFLNNEGIVNAIVDSAGIEKSDIVIEVGPGIGSMTGVLAGRAGRVVAVEIDRRLIEPLKDNLSGYGNISIVNGDILKVDIRSLIADNLLLPDGTRARNVKVVANLPYYITTPIIMKFLEEEPGIDTMVFMVQKEVADRMAASPGRKDYGALSVVVQYYSKPDKVIDVPPHVFIPQPDVDSAVVRLSIYREPPVALIDRDLFFRIVKASFGQRRKTLVNALSNSGLMGLPKEKIKELVESTGIKENQRGETLSISQFAELANTFSSECRR